MISRAGTETSRFGHRQTGWFGPPPSRATLARLGRYLGALALLGVGVDHIEQYYVDFYSAIPKIGTLFLLNFASAALVTLGLLAPVERFAGRRAPAVLALLAIGGIGVAAGSLVGLLVSENGGLFGFMEQGYREAIVFSIVLEVATIGLLALFLAANGLGIRPRHWPSEHSRPRPRSETRCGSTAALQTESGSIDRPHPRPQT